MGLLKARTPRTGSEPALRNPVGADIDRIRRVLQVAFEDENRRMGMRETRLPTLRDELLGFMIDRSPSASFVAEQKGGIVAFCLACQWGTTGWLGPIAVLPPAQGRGIGRRLVEASRSALQQNGVTTLGIETMPRSYRNLNFYSRLGMRFESLTLDMSLTLSREDPWAGVAGERDDRLTEIGSLAAADQVAALESVAQIGHRISPGLDYRSEVVKTVEHRLGDTCLVHDHGEPAAFAVVHTSPYAREEIAGTARINTLLVSIPEEGESGRLTAFLDEFLRRVVSWIGKAGGDSLTIRVPTSQSTVHHLLARRGFRITHSDVRMTFEGMSCTQRPGTVHLSKWE